MEERKKAIIEAEKERREYILKKNLVSESYESLSKLSHDSRSLSHSFFTLPVQERESRIETKRRDRNSIAFAFGSSTPRLLDVPADYGLVSPSTFWSQRRYVAKRVWYNYYQFNSIKYTYVINNNSSDFLFHMLSI